MAGAYGFSFDAGSLVDSGAAFLQSYLNYQAQKEALDWDKERYYSTLEYNKPANQMIRLAEAGINPHMAYAKGTINNIASPAPHLQAPQIDIPKLGDRLEQLVNMKKMSADIQNMEETNKNIQEQNKKIAAETRKAEAEARIAEHDAGIIEKSPFSSRANDTQSLAQFFGNYGGKIGEYFNPRVAIEKVAPVVIRYVLNELLPHQSVIYSPKPVARNAMR